MKPTTQPQTKESKEVLHTHGKWQLNWQRSGYSITEEFPEGYKKIALLLPDQDYTTKKECKLNGMRIVNAVNERQRLLDSNRELLDVAKSCLFIFNNEANYPEGTVGYRLSQKAQTAINNAKNLQS